MAGPLQERQAEHGNLTLKTAPGKDSRHRSNSTTRSSPSSRTSRSCTRSSPPSSPPAAPARRAPRPAPKCAVVAASPTPRRAPATPARARSGHRTSPVVAWPSGPKPRKYDQKTPKKMVKLALKSALSDRATEGKIIVVDSWGIDIAEDQDAKLALDALGIDGTALVVVGRDDAAAALSFRNLPEGADHRPRRTQRLRRALQRVDRVHQGRPARPARRPSAARCRRAADGRPANRESQTPDEGSPRHHPRSGRFGEELRPHRDRASTRSRSFHRPPSPRSATLSSRSGASRC